MEFWGTLTKHLIEEFIFFTCRWPNLFVILGREVVTVDVDDDGEESVVDDVGREDVEREAVLGSAAVSGWKLSPASPLSTSLEKDTHVL